MFDFVRIKKEFVAKKQRYIYKPSFGLWPRTKDLMVRGRDFYALIDPETNMWIKDEAQGISLIDKQVEEKVRKEVGEEVWSDPEHAPIVHKIADTDTGLIDKFHKFVQRDMRDNFKLLNQKVKFSNSEITRKDYCTYKLDYPLQEGPTPFYDKLVNTLYLPEEREKFEWAVGAVLAGDQSKIQKIFVFYGLPGSGKSTIINKVIVDQIFNGASDIDDDTDHKSPYCAKFTAGLLTGGDKFGTEFLAKDPVLAFDDDADLSRIDDATTLNLIISHEAVRVNGKFERTFITYPNCILICGTNEPVQLSPNSGMNRRLIDIRQTGIKLPPDEYDECIEHLKFERSGIAWKCYQVYKSKGKNYYNHYIPQDMLLMTSPFQNFIQDSYLDIHDGITLAAAYNLYKKYCDECNFKTVMTRYKFRDNLRLYFATYENNAFSGFKDEMIGIKAPDPAPLSTPVGDWLDFSENDSVFDAEFKGAPAQLANKDGFPPLKWANCDTKLKDLDTHKLHYVRVPENFVVVDLDIKDENGEKNFELNKKAALAFPKTYAELSKSGQGIHLHYWWKGSDPKALSRVIGDDIEVKVFTGNSSLRRMLSKCNTLPIATLTTGLPKKEEKIEMPTVKEIKDEKHLRNLVRKALRKEFSEKGLVSTKQNVDFIDKIIKEAYELGKTYDIRDLIPAVWSFGMDSTNHADYCIRLISYMQFCSKDIRDAEAYAAKDINRLFAPTAPIIFFDCEVFQNLFVICWKYPGDTQTVRMINPTPDEVEALFKFRMIGFNNRKYDNHILYARSQGYSNKELYRLSQSIIANDPNAMFPMAYNLSYTDIYDFSVKKQSLKKFEIEYGIHHQENEIPWNQPVPADRVNDIADYCCNDVMATEVTFNNRKADFEAREILVEIANKFADGILSSCNDTTNTLTRRIIFGNDKEPQKQFVYTDFSTGEMQYADGRKVYSETNHFVGYHYEESSAEYSRGRNWFRDVDLGLGGYVYANPGMYGRVITFDVRSMHPNSMIQLNLFGDIFTKKFKELVDLRAEVKHKNYDKAKSMFDGALAPYLEDESMAKSLAGALKIAINSVYGLTSATFRNAFKDDRNVNNIVALRGALFMKSLQDEVESMGYKVVHIKTDSIKIADPDEKIFNFIMDYGHKYGYDFEIEHIFEKFCLVNNAVYISKLAKDDPEEPGAWEATGKQFQIPYVYKKLFTKEQIVFEDLCQTIATQSALYLHLDDDSYKFVGKVGSFVPVIQGIGGGDLMRLTNTGGYAYAPGCKGYKFMESETVKELELEDKIDYSFFDKLCTDAVETISNYGDFTAFAS